MQPNYIRIAVNGDHLECVALDISELLTSPTRLY